MGEAEGVGEAVTVGEAVAVVVGDALRSVVVSGPLPSAGEVLSLGFLVSSARCALAAVAHRAQASQPPPLLPPPRSP